MRWNTLRLRTRILLGYGFVLLLSSLVCLFLLFRANALNEQLRTLNSDVGAETLIGVQLNDAVVSAQQAIDRYLQQPTDPNLTTANTSLQQLEDTLDTARNQADDADHVDHVVVANSIFETFTIYRAEFQQLTKTIDQQNELRSQSAEQLFNVTLGLNDAISSYLRTASPNVLTLRTLTLVQQDMQIVNLLAGRLWVEQNPALGEQASQELATSGRILEGNLSDLAVVSASVTKASTAIKNLDPLLEQYTNNISLINDQRNQLLNIDGTKLKEEATAISSTALERLSIATAQLEQESNRAQQMVLGVLLVLLVLSAGFGLWLARTITMPITIMAHATAQIADGEYDVSVPTNDGGELGLLARSFNQMAVTLKAQSQDVRFQQTALTVQNTEMAATLKELQAAQAARDLLSETIREMSVPVIPLLRDVMMIPLVGEIDTVRAQTLLERMLEGITRERARIVILDITGVPLVDEELVGWLIHANQAAQLLGSRCWVVGISPEVAQALVASGADLQQFSTRADLRSAVEEAVRRTQPRAATHVR